MSAHAQKKLWTKWIRMTNNETRSQGVQEKNVHRLTNISSRLHLQTQKYAKHCKQMQHKTWNLNLRKAAHSYCLSHMTRCHRRHTFRQKSYLGEEGTKGHLEGSGRADDHRQEEKTEAGSDTRYMKKYPPQVTRTQKYKLKPEQKIKLTVFNDFRRWCVTHVPFGETRLSEDADVTPCWTMLSISSFPPHTSSHILTSVSVPRPPSLPVTLSHPPGLLALFLCLTQFGLSRLLLPVTLHCAAILLFGTLELPGAQVDYCTNPARLKAF